MNQIRIFIATLLLAASLICGVSPSAKCQWVQAPGPYGAPFIGVTPSEGSVYAFTNSEIFVSNDAAATWQLLDAPNILYPNLAGMGSNLFVSTFRDGIYRSTDRGLSWKQIDTSIKTEELSAPIMVSGAKVFVGTSKGVFESADSGITWSGTSEPILQNSAVTVLAQAGTKLFAGTTGNGIFISNDAGVHWAAINSGLQGDVNSLAFIGGNVFAGTDSGVLISTNDGANWNAAHTGLPIGGSVIAAIGTNLFAATGGGIFLSTDNAVSWTLVSSLNSLSSFIANGTDLFATSFQGLYRSSDNGQSWQSACTGINRLQVRSIVSVGNDLLVNGYFRSQDHGATWEELNSNIKYDIGTIVQSGTLLYTATQNGIFRSSDVGSSWTAAGLADSSVNALCASGNTLVASTVTSDYSAGSEFFSTDGGANWFQANGIDPSDFVQSFAVMGTTLFAGGYYSGLYVSNDNGANWSAIGAGLGAGTVYSLVSKGTKLFANVGTNGEVDCSTDSGWTWTNVTGNLSAVYGMQLVASGSYLFAATGNGVFYTTNDGGSWIDANTGTYPTGFGHPEVNALAVVGSGLFAGSEGLWHRPLSELDTVKTVPALGYWSEASSTGFVGGFGIASALIDGKIYVMGGQTYPGIIQHSLQVYDPLVDSWSTPTTTGTFTGRQELSASVVGGKIYVMGGQTGVAVNSGSGLSTLEVFDPATNTWSTPVTSGHLTPRRYLATAVVDGKIYAIGGADGSALVSALDVFDPSTNAWSTLATTGTFTARSGATASVVNSKIYVFGGSDAPSHVTNVLEVFDPQSNSWSTPSTTGTSTARSGATSFVLDGKVCVFGGSNGSSASKALELFDPATNTWTTPTTIGNYTGRNGARSEVSGTKVYVLGGSRGDALDNLNEVLSPYNSNVVESKPGPSNIEIYPNPTNGIVTVQCASIGTHNITVTNVLGGSVLELSETGSTGFTLDLSNLNPGTYFIRLSGDGTPSSGMIVRK